MLVLSFSVRPIAPNRYCSQLLVLDRPKIESCDVRGCTHTQVFFDVCSDSDSYTLRYINTYTDRERKKIGKERIERYGWWWLVCVNSIDKGGQIVLKWNSSTISPMFHRLIPIG